MAARVGHRPPPGEGPGRLPRTAAGLARHRLAQRVLPRLRRPHPHPGFVAATGTLLEQAAREPTAVTCGESVRRRCHRRIVADFALPRPPRAGMSPDARSPATCRCVT
ncbi:DUF488 family protein [Streptomyces sp. NPDC017966]|uniref:DUF488 family protein n=1 Tax=Streptomyces sp. NPDC017966 TaxID=3365023 RepID=UPI003798E275